MIVVKGGLLQSPERMCSIIDLLYKESLSNSRIVHANEHANEAHCRQTTRSKHWNEVVQLVYANSYYTTGPRRAVFTAIRTICMVAYYDPRDGAVAFKS